MHSHLCSQTRGSCYHHHSYKLFVEFGRSAHSRRVLGAEVLELDVTSSPSVLNARAKSAVEIYGRVDVLVNNAGYGSLSALEEFTAEEDFSQYNTNLFGGVNIARAFLNYMREQKVGTIIWIGSITGWATLVLRGGQRCYAMYVLTHCTNRYMLSGIPAMSETLNAEISHFGLRSIVVEFGYLNNDVARKTLRFESRIPEYDATMNPIRIAHEALHGNMPGDPEKGADIVVDLARGEGVAAGNSEVPTVIGLGEDYYNEVTQYAQDMLDRLEEWKDVICSTGRDSAN